MEIIVGTTQACMASFDNPDLAKCWLMMLLGQMTPAGFLNAVKMVTHHNPDVLTHAKMMVRGCMGTAI
jgi:hypothetical protein